MVDPTSTGGTQVIPDGQAIRSELEVARKSYHELVNSLSDEDWKKTSGNAAWRVGQLMWHLAWGLQYFPQGVSECRKGKAMNPPNWIVNPGNALITRFGSRGATRESVLQKYDAAHEKLLACLETVQDDEWQKGVRSFGQYNTIESIFHQAREHFKEHEADVLKGLGR